MFISSLVFGVTALLATAVQSTKCTAVASGPGTFGYNPLGTVSTKTLPKFLTNNPLPDGYPWGKRTSRYDDPKCPPNTGVTRYYDWTISRGTDNPDGVQKAVMYINGQFPGPMIEANWGDWIQVTVHNNITGPEDGTSIHWHGLLQKETPWMDGVPSISQCPIAPKSTFEYRFRADIYGTSWYHSHYSAQYLDGAFGPLVIYGPTHVKYDVDLGPILLQDYFHREFFPVLQDEMSSNATLQAQFSDSTLINGRMPFNCSLASKETACDSSKSQYSKFRVQSGKTYKMRLINSGAGSIEYFSIDNHQVTIVANDFVDIEPYNTTIVTLGTGQRSDILFTPKGNGSVWMRTQTSGKFCGGARSANPKAQAIILIDAAPESTIPTSTPYAAPVDDGQCANDPLNKTVPAYPIALSPPSVTYNITINQFVNATGQKLFYMNGNSFQADYNDPILLLAQQKNYSYPYDPKWNVVNFQTNSSIRINIWNNNTSPHPMHLHGHDMYILHAGPGQWDGVSITNPSNPQRRDTQNLAPFGHIAIQYDADNPGTWPFHCHIGWHLAQGLYMTFMEKPTEINQREIPDVMAQTCRDWDTWTSRNMVMQIDSGLKKREQSVRRSLKTDGEWVQKS